MSAGHAAVQAIDRPPRFNFNDICTII